MKTVYHLTKRKANIGDTPPQSVGQYVVLGVNIQAAFAGVFSSNHLELGKVFSDGLLSYWELVKNFAKNTHDLPGAAIDYPYFMYYCVFPWRAQYLWAYYEYSKDADYLKQVYPMFLDLCEFAAALFQWVSIHSCAGGTARLTTPAGFADYRVW